MLTKKWVIEVDNYEAGEVISSDILTEGRGKLEKMIIFDTVEEAEVCSRTVSNEFQLPNILKLDVDESCCINYKEIVARRAKEEELRKSSPKPCPFCGQQPTKMNLSTRVFTDLLKAKAPIVYLNCNTCNICLKEEMWNTRK